MKNVLATHVVTFERNGDLSFAEVVLPAKVQVLAVSLMRGTVRTGRLAIRVRQMGPPHLPNTFLIRMNTGDQIPLPHIERTEHDPPDSDDLQWYLWQGRRVGGDIGFDVFNVTGLSLT